MELGTTLSRQLLRAAIGIAFAVGTLCIAEAGWIHAKALLAQILIESAWRREQAGAQRARPWPWADTRPFARLTVGKSGNFHEVMVLEGSNGRNLAFGPTHEPASVSPGAIGNSVIEGHRDTHFAFLRSVALGEQLQTVLPDGHMHRFVVTDIRIVDSRRSRIALDADHARVTLVTCYPFDAVVPGGPFRYVITADAVNSR